MNQSINIEILITKCYIDKIIIFIQHLNDTAIFIESIRWKHLQYYNLIIGTKQIESLLVYDRQSLLFIRRNVSDLNAFDHSGQYTLPLFLAGISSPGLAW